MAMETIGLAALAPELKQTYDKMLLMTAEENFVFLRYGYKRGIPTRGGKSIEFRRFENIPVYVGSHVLTEGTPPVEANASISNVEATISQYGMYSRLTDILETQSFDPLIGEYSERFGYAMSECLDNVARDIVDAGTTTQYADDCNTEGTSTRQVGSHQPIGSGNYLDGAEILEAVNTLKRNSAKPLEGGKYICIIHPDNTRDMFADPDVVRSFEHAANRGDANPIFSGVLGDWGGARFVETTNLGINASNGLSGADVYEVVMLGQEAYGVIDLDAQQAQVIVHPRGTGGHTDPLDQYSTIGWKAAMACKILNQNFLVVIKCAASRASAA